MSCSRAQHPISSRGIQTGPMTFSARILRRVRLYAFQRVRLERKELEAVRMHRSVQTADMSSSKAKRMTFSEECRAPSRYLSQRYADRRDHPHLKPGTSPSDGNSSKAKFSTDGRYIVFETAASGLFAADSNGSLNDIVWVDPARIADGVAIREGRFVELNFGANPASTVTMAWGNR